MKTIYEKSVKGKTSRLIAKQKTNYEPKHSKALPEKLQRKQRIGLPNLSEPEVVRHYTTLSQRNFSIDTHFYPLGSCTMKYNPKINDRIALFPELMNIHPNTPLEFLDGAVQILGELSSYIAEIIGLPYVSLQPAAGAQGEFVGISIIREYFKQKGEDRKVMLIPDSAHGTNPASAVIAGFTVKTIKSNKNGTLDIEHLKSQLSKDVAGIMLTNPNTLGIFEYDIQEIATLLHQNGSLLYYDGANLNAIVGRVRPGDMGFDVVHINLHKTFSTPHGGGGPGAGPVAVNSTLKEYLPNPIFTMDNGEVHVEQDLKHTIGKIRSFFGNWPVLIRAYTYMRALGKENLPKISDYSVLNATYLKNLLKDVYQIGFEGTSMHEFVLTFKNFREHGVHAIDLAKRLLDYGIHPPTVYFPLIVTEAIMIEPTDSESKETLDHFAEVMKKIADEIKTSPEKLKEAPITMPVRRLDEVKAVKEPILTDKASVY